MKEKDKKNKTEDKNNDKIEINVSETKESNSSEQNPVADEIEELKRQVEQFKDSLLRKAAEFENYKKRTENEITSYFKYASEKLIKKLLPVYDNLNRAVDSIEKGETKDFETLQKGVISIKDNFQTILENEGLKEIDCLNKEFNVDLSDALLTIPKEDVQPHTVVEVVEKGYYFKDKVIRHAKVIVSAEPEIKNM
jgi:molecular chaperone GrpE